MSEKDKQVWKKKDGELLPLASVPEPTVQPQNLSGDFEILDNSKTKGESTRVSLVQRNNQVGTVDRPTSSQPLYVNLRSGPKLIVPTRPRRRSTRLSLQRTRSFEEYEGTPGFSQFGTSNVTKDGTTPRLSNASEGAEPQSQEDQDRENQELLDLSLGESSCGPERLREWWERSG